MTASSHSESFDPIAALGDFTALLKRVSWFAHVGEPVDSAHRGLALDYLSGMGASDCSVAYIHDWSDALDIAASLDADASWREEEDRLMDELAALALSHASEDDLRMAMTTMIAELSRIIPAAIRARMQAEGEIDDALADAIFGATIHAVEASALLVTSGGGSDISPLPEGFPHPFHSRFRLYELGHWPIGIVGRSFFVF